MWSLTSCKYYLFPGHSLQFIDFISKMMQLCIDILGCYCRPLAIFGRVLGIAILGLLLLIGTSFASSNITRIVNTDLSMPIGQLYLDTFEKKGMLAVWNICVIIQVDSTYQNHRPKYILIFSIVDYWCYTRSGCILSHVHASKG